jgi:(S)-2-hydroxy-acid oxidase
MQIWLKGVCSPADVELAIHYGVDGIVISNHGGRQLDGVPATLDSLRLCAEVAKGRIPLAIDGGIRRGSDIFKALALGASYCFMGRIPIWGLAVGLSFLFFFFFVALICGALYADGRSTMGRKEWSWQSRFCGRS